MKRWCKENIPKCPKDIQDFVQQLQSDPKAQKYLRTVRGKEFYSSTLEGPDWTTIVFLSPEILDKISYAGAQIKIGVDGTFDWVPKIFKQMLTLHVQLEEGVSQHLHCYLFFLWRFHVWWSEPVIAL